MHERSPRSNGADASWAAFRGRRQALRSPILLGILLLGVLGLSAAAAQDEIKVSGDVVAKSPQGKEGEKSSAETLSKDAQAIANFFQLITERDVKLYLEVMREATFRLQHLSPAERQTLARAKQIRKELEAAKPGDDTPTDGKTKDLEAKSKVLIEAAELQMSMDEKLVRERNLGLDRYLAVKSVVNALVLNKEPESDEASPAQKMTRRERRIERFQEETKQIDQKLLAGYEAEIRALNLTLMRSASEE